MRLRQAFLAIVAFTVLTGAHPLPAADGAEAGAPAASVRAITQPVPAPEDLPLQPGDMISVEVAGEPQLSGAYYVDPRGTVDLPMVGSVPAAGRTAAVLTDEITGRLERYVLRPRVKVSHIGGAARMVSILGAVSAPGSYDQRGHAGLLSLLAAAGGPTPEADLRRTTLIRGDEQALVGAARSEGGRMAMPDNVSLQPGDTVYVPSVVDRAVRVVGAVGSPGLAVLEDGLTVSRAVLAAGGPRDDADLRYVQLLRATERSTLDLRPILRPDTVPPDVEADDALLQLDDIIIVPQLASRSVQVIGAVRAPGAHSARDAERVSRAIALAGGATEEGDLAAVYILREGRRIELDLRALLSVDGGEADGAEVDAATEPGDVVVVPQFRPVHVLGAVNQPGAVVAGAARTVSQALFTAGGLTPEADRSAAYIVRSGEQIRVDLEALLEQGDAAVDIALEPEDALIVPVAPQIVNVVGAVQAPGSYPIREAATLADLWGRAGGPLETANTSACVLLRDAESEVVNVRALIEDGAIEHNRTLRPGDTLLVPKIAQEAYVFGAVQKPGVISIQEGDTIIDIIARAGGPTSGAHVSRIALVRRSPADQMSLEPERRSLARPRSESEEASGAGDWQDRRTEWNTARTGSAPDDSLGDEAVIERIEEGDRSLHLFDLAEVREDDAAYLARPGDVIWVPPVDLRRSSLNDMLREMLLRAPFYAFF